MKLGDLVKLATGRGQVPTAEEISASVLGALGELHLRRGEGQPLEVVWTAPKPGRVAARIVTRDANGTRYISLFSGEGRAKAPAVLNLWTLCQSAVGHSEGSAWARTARDLAVLAEELAKGEGLL
jgi:hypothetical protein